MKLKSFGCSFTYGTDLSDCFGPMPGLEDPSKLTWPALTAANLRLPYECYAWPGIGNFKILCDVINQATLDDPAIFVINWTWIDRFDFVNDLEHWDTVRPGQNCKRSNIYYRHFHSHFKDMIDSVYNINTAATFLLDQRIPFVMTCMDYNILATVDPNWHDPKYLSAIQKRIKTYLVSFDGKNFLDWSREKAFPISNKWHPLEEAHAAAADYLSPVIDAILRKV